MKTLASLSEGAQTLEAYQYLGVGTVVVRSQPESGIELTYVQQEGDAAANTDGGDIYTGLDRFGRVIDQNWIDTNDDNASVDRYQYTYDRNSNVTAKNNLVYDAAASQTIGEGDLDEEYGYDDLNRLTSTTRGGSAYQSWDLDALGNMSSVTTGETTVDRTGNSGNQITSVGDNDLAYDKNGNTTTDEQGHTLVYDAWNRVVSVSNGETLLKSYTYDGASRRVTEYDCMNTVDNYFSAQGQVIEQDQGGHAILQNLWSPVYINALVLRDRDSNPGDETHTLDQRVYMTQDANFNVTGMVTSADSVWSTSLRVVYDGYGNASFYTGAWSGTTNTLHADTLFQGMHRDAATGLYHSLSRLYDPGTGTWLSQDVGYLDNLNLYQADGNSPINHRDPTGLYYTASVGPYFFTDPKTREMGVYFVRSRLPGWMDRWIPGAAYIGNDHCGSTWIKKYEIGDAREFFDKWNKKLFKTIPEGERTKFVDEIRILVRLEAADSLLDMGADATMNGFLFMCGMSSFSGLTSSIGKMSTAFGRSPAAIRAAIESAKQSGLYGGGAIKNPDVMVDLETGEIYPQLPSGGTGDSIGNIMDFLQ